MIVKEVIVNEGGEIVLYSKDRSKVLGRFPYGEGKEYKNAETARKAAEERERQVQYFKHKGAGGVVSLDAMRVYLALHDKQRLPEVSLRAKTGLQDVAAALISLQKANFAESSNTPRGRMVWRRTKKPFPFRMLGSISSDDLEQLTDDSEAELVPNPPPVLNDAGQFPPRSQEKGEATPDPEPAPDEQANICVCLKCDTQLERGDSGQEATPCSELQCPKCGTPMRDATEEEDQETSEAAISAINLLGARVRTPEGEGDLRSFGRTRSVVFLLSTREIKEFPNDQIMLYMPESSIRPIEETLWYAIGSDGRVLAKTSAPSEDIARERLRDAMSPSLALAWEKAENRLEMFEAQQSPDLSDGAAVVIEDDREGDDNEEGYRHVCQGCGTVAFTSFERPGGSGRPPKGWDRYIQRGQFQFLYCDKCIADGTAKGERMAPFRYYDEPYGRYREVDYQFYDAQTPGGFWYPDHPMSWQTPDELSKMTFEEHAKGLRYAPGRKDAFIRWLPLQGVDPINDVLPRFTWTDLFSRFEGETSGHIPTRTSWHIHSLNNGREFAIWYTDQEGYDRPYGRKNFAGNDPTQLDAAKRYIDQLKRRGHVMATGDSTPRDYEDLKEQIEFWGFASVQGSQRHDESEVQPGSYRSVPTPSRNVADATRSIVPISGLGIHRGQEVLLPAGWGFLKARVTGHLASGSKTRYVIIKAASGEIKAVHPSLLYVWQTRSQESLPWLMLNRSEWVAELPVYTVSVFQELDGSWGCEFLDGAVVLAGEYGMGSADDAKRWAEREIVNVPPATGTLESNGWHVGQCVWMTTPPYFGQISAIQGGATPYVVLGSDAAHHIVGEAAIIRAMPCRDIPSWATQSKRFRTSLSAQWTQVGAGFNPHVYELAGVSPFDVLGKVELIGNNLWRAWVMDSGEMILVGNQFGDRDEAAQAVEQRLQQATIAAHHRTVESQLNKQDAKNLLARNGYQFINWDFTSGDKMVFTAENPETVKVWVVVWANNGRFEEYDNRNEAIDAEPELW